MKRPKVLNKHKDKIPKGSIYIGRPSVWGNPFTLEDHNYNRDKVLSLFRLELERWIEETPNFLETLRFLSKAPGLVCFCAPERCYGDILVEKMEELGFFE